MTMRNADALEGLIAAPMDGVDLGLPQRIDHQHAIVSDDEAGVGGEPLICGGGQTELTSYTMGMRTDLDWREFDARGGREMSVPDAPRNARRIANAHASQALPGLPCAPWSRGRFKEAGLMIDSLRRCYAIMSRMGSPPVFPASSDTGAQPATLYRLVASISEPFRLLSLARLPAIARVLRCSPVNRPMPACGARSAARSSV